MKRRASAAPSSHCAPSAAATNSSSSRRAPLAERIQKVLADLGLGSRREIDRWVVEGRVTIDGRAARPGDQLSGRERVCVDGRPVKRIRPARGQPPSFAAYYKPGGAAVSEPTSRRDTGFPVPPKHGRWIPVSPPDTSTAGLVVLTTDGALAHRLARRARAIEQEFAVRLLGQPTVERLERLTEGVDLDEGFVAAAVVEPRGGGANNVWYHVTLREGGSRELRALLDAAGLSVSRLIRIRYGPVKLGSLRRAQSRALSRQESDALYALAAARD